MAELPKWDTIASDPAFAALDSNDREAVRTEYKRKLVEMHYLSGGEDGEPVASLISQFDRATKPSVFQRIADRVTGRPTAASAAAMGLSGASEVAAPTAQEIAVASSPSMRMASSGLGRRTAQPSLMVGKFDAQADAAGAGQVAPFSKIGLAAIRDDVATNGISATDRAITDPTSAVGRARKLAAQGLLGPQVRSPEQMGAEQKPEEQSWLGNAVDANKLLARGVAQGTGSIARAAVEVPGRIGDWYDSKTAYLGALLTGETPEQATLIADKLKASREGMRRDVIDPLAEKGGKILDYLLPISQGTKKLTEKEIFDGNPLKGEMPTLKPDSSLAQVVMKMYQTLGQMAPIVLGGVLTGGAGGMATGGALGFAQAADEGGNEEGKRIRELTPSQMRDIPLYKQYRTEGLSHEEAVLATSADAGRAASLVQGMLGSLDGLLFPGAGAAARKSIAKVALKDGAVQGMQEAAESAGSRTAASLAVGEKLDPERIGKGLYDDAALGAVTGKVIGGSQAAGSNAALKAEEQASAKFDASIKQGIADKVASTFGRPTPVTDGITGAPETKATSGSRSSTPVIQKNATVIQDEPVSADVLLGARPKSPVDIAAHEAATSPLNDKPEPTQAQKEAGTYAKGHTKIAGLDIAIENPQGSVRKGVDADGKAWESTLADHYGYVKGTIGNDKDAVDTFIKAGTQPSHSGPVFVIDQVDPKTGKLDEHKAIIGAANEAEARTIYQRNYAKDWNGLGAITQLPIAAFKSWVKDGAKREPLGDITGWKAEAEPKAIASAPAKDTSLKATATLAQAIRKFGGLPEKFARDLTGEPALTANKLPGYRGLFHASGTDLSTLVHDGKLDAYLPPNLRSDVRDDSRPTDTDAAVAHIEAILRNGEAQTAKSYARTEAKQQRLTAAAQKQQVVAPVQRGDTQAAADAISEAEYEHFKQTGEPGFDWMPGAEAFADSLDANTIEQLDALLNLPESTDERAAMRSMGFTEDEITETLGPDAAASAGTNQVPESAPAASESTPASREAAPPAAEVAKTGDDRARDAELFRKTKRRLIDAFTGKSGENFDELSKTLTARANDKNDPQSKLAAEVLDNFDGWKGNYEQRQAFEKNRESANPNEAAAKALESAAVAIRAMAAPQAAAKATDEAKADDMRGRAWALVKNGNVVRSGSLPAPQYSPEGPDTKASYYRDMADQQGADLYIGGYPASDASPLPGTIFGMSWEQLNAKQQRSSNRADLPKGKMPSNAVLAYSPSDPQARPALDLTNPTESKLRTDDAKQKRDAAEKAAKENAPSPEEFGLVGSNRAADVGVAAGQKDLLAEKPAEKRKTDKTTAVYEALLKKKSTRLLKDHGNGRILYDVTITPEFRNANFVHGRMPRADGFELRDKADITGNPFDKGYVLIDSREQLRARGEPLFSRSDTIEVDGQQRPRNNSNGKPIAATDDMFADDFTNKRSKVDTGLLADSKGGTIKGGNANSDGKAVTFTKQGLAKFWNWFGASVAVDVKNRPLVLYHSTNQDVAAFKTGVKTSNNYGLLGDVETTRAAIFVTPERDFSQEYLRDGGGKNVMQVYASLQNPIDLRQGLSESDERALESRGVNINYIRNIQNDWELFDNDDNGKNEFVDVLKALDFDGAIFYETGLDGERHKTYAVFSPNQLKSATGNTGQFSPDNADIRFSRAAKADPKDLIVQHNLSISNLRHAMRMGGIAVPSLAVTKSDTPMVNFGEITLLGDRDLVDPRGYAGTKVFGADIYSPRYPTVSYDLGKQALKNLNEELRPFRDALPDGASSKRETYSGEVTKADDLIGNKAFDAWVKANGFGDGYHDQRDAFARLMEVVGADEKLRNGYTAMGRPKYKPHTLDAVVAYLKKELRGGEGFNYGLGSVRAKYTPQFKSITQIKANSDRLVSKEQFDAIKKEMDDELISVGNTLAEFHANSNNYGYLDAVTMAMGDAVKMGVGRALTDNGFMDVSPEARTKFVEFIVKLRSLPTEYFEAKILREVDLSEFKHAVIPSDTPSDVRTMLESRGLKVTEYGEQTKRAEAVKQAAESSDLVFSLKGDEQQPTTTNTHAADVIAKAAKTVNIPLDVYATPQEASAKLGIYIPSDVRGLHYRGRAALISSNITTRAMGEFVLWHELFHAGITLVAPRYSNEYNRIMQDMAARNSNIIKAARDWRNSYGAETIKRSMEAGLSQEQAEKRMRLMAIEEAIADLAGANVELKGWTQFVAKLQALLRSMGFDNLANWIEGKSNAEVLQLITRTRDEVTTQNLHLTTQVPAFAREDEPLESRTDTIEVDGKARSRSNSNGKPIATTDEGLRNFWKWFADSRVVDERGRPLVVYHGTGADIEVFDNAKGPERKNTKGVSWFSSSPNVANDFAGEQTGGRIAGVTLGYSNVLPVYLKIENPVPERSARSLAIGGGLDRAEAKSWSDEGYDGIAWLNSDFDLPDNDPRGYSREFDGGVYGEDVPYPNQYAIFSPAQAKSATGNTGAFSPDNADIRYSRETPLWRSTLTEAIGKTSFAQAPADQWKAWLNANAAKLGVKKDEIEWSGVTDWLDLQKGKVARDQVREFLDANGVKVTETMLADGEYEPTFVEQDDDGMWRVYGERANEGDVYDTAEQANAKSEEYNADIPAGPSKYSSYQLPGGTNYRELLLTLPKSVPTQEFRSIAQMKDFLQNNPRADLDGMSDLDKFKAINKERRKAGDQQKDFQSSHWDQPNILAHIRFNERTDADGKRVLFIEEIQSDWGQEGKKKGFARSKEAIQIEFDKVRQQYLDTPRSSPSFAAIEQRMGELRNENGNGTPSAPFVGKTEAWVSLALKRMIRYAVDNGFDRIAMVNGEQSAERYDLSKQVDSITVPMVNADSRSVRITPTGGSPIKLMVDNKGIVDGYGQSSTQFSGKPLDEIIGKGLADKVMAAQAGDVLSGDGLKVGGEGMKAFYDRIVPQVANDVLKKLGGGKVVAVSIRSHGKHKSQGVTFGDTTLDPNKTRIEKDNGVWRVVVDYGNGDERFHGTRFSTKREAQEYIDANTLSTYAQPGFDITDKMREHAAQGMPLFRRDEQQSTATNTHAADVIAKAAKTVNIPLDVYATPQEASAKLGIDIPSDVRGLHYRGRAALISSNITTRAMGEFVLWHELLHAGITQVAPRYGNEYNRIMQDMAARNSNIIKAARDWRNSYGAETIKRSMEAGLSQEQAEKRMRLMAIEEAIADLAGANIELKGWTQFVAKLQALLRSMGFDNLANWIEGKSNAEVLQLIARTRDEVTTQNLHLTTQVPAFARDEDDASYQRAYHGTPHKFDKFSLDKIGTGEGAQAYGYGLYFASKREIAEHYRNALGRPDSAGLSRAQDLAAWAYSMQSPYAGDAMEHLNDEIARMEKHGKFNDKVLRSDYEEAKRIVASGEVISNGKLYQVDIPEDSEMLHWDKPLSEQPKIVRDAFKRRVVGMVPFDGLDMGGNAVLLDNRDGQASSTTIQPWVLRTQSANGTSNFGLTQKDVDRMLGSKDAAEMTGQQLYTRITAGQKSQKAASAYLASLGIRGIKYLDGGSRNAGDGSYNYVVFDDNDVSIEAVHSRTDTIEVDGKARSRSNSNGKPIAATDEGLRNFWRWFADSRVVDEQGRPLQIYHGTGVNSGNRGEFMSGDFDVFDGGLSGKSSKTGAPEYSFFFTNKPDVASSYTVQWRGDFSERLKESANVMPVYLNLSAPLKVNAKGENWREILYKGEYRTLNEIVQLAKDSGKYDGVIFTKVIDNGVGKVSSSNSITYVAFSPSQIKSSTGNNGQFSPDNADIRFSRNEQTTPQDGDVAKTSPEVTALLKRLSVLESLRACI